jgi:hypothetical protein
LAVVGCAVVRGSGWLLCVLLLVVGLAGCVEPDDDDDATQDDDDATSDDDDATQDDDDATSDDDDVTPPPCDEAVAGLAVTIDEDLDRLPLCDEPEPWRCADGYDAFFEHPETQLEALPIDGCEAWVEGLLAGAEQGGPPPYELEVLSDGAELAEEIPARTGMGFLFEPTAFAERPLQVTVIARRERTSPTGAAYRELELLLTDEFVGELQALLLLPEQGEGPFPTVLALPGHIEDAAQHRDLRFGRFFPEHGFALLIVTQRAYEQPWDHAVAVDFLCEGFHLMTFRAYEALVAMKFLLASPLACNGRLGVIGHSGGSVTGALLSWLPGNPARAFVTDGRGEYWNVDGTGLPELPWAIDCETHPELAPIAEYVNDHAAAPMPTIEVPYAYAADFGGPEPDPGDVAALQWFVPFFVDELVLSP